MIQLHYISFSLKKDRFTVKLFINNESLEEECIGYSRIVIDSKKHKRNAGTLSKIHVYLNTCQLLHV